MVLCIWEFFFPIFNSDKKKMIKTGDTVSSIKINVLKFQLIFKLNNQTSWDFLTFSSSGTRPVMKRTGVRRIMLH